METDENIPIQELLQQLSTPNTTTSQLSLGDNVLGSLVFFNNIIQLLLESHASGDIKTAHQCSILIKPSLCACIREGHTLEEHIISYISLFNYDFDEYTLENIAIGIIPFSISNTTHILYGILSDILDRPLLYYILPYIIPITSCLDYITECIISHFPNDSFLYNSKTAESVLLLIYHNIKRINPLPPGLDDIIVELISNISEIFQYNDKIVYLLISIIEEYVILKGSDTLQQHILETLSALINSINSQKNIFIFHCLLNIGDLRNLNYINFLFAHLIMGSQPQEDSNLIEYFYYDIIFETTEKCIIFSRTNMILEILHQLEIDENSLIPFSLIMHFFFQIINYSISKEIISWVYETAMRIHSLIENNSFPLLSTQLFILLLTDIYMIDNDPISAIIEIPLDDILSLIPQDSLEINTLIFNFLEVFLINNYNKVSTEIFELISSLLQSDKILYIEHGISMILKIINCITFDMNEFVPLCQEIFLQRVNKDAVLLFSKIVAQTEDKDLLCYLIHNAFSTSENKTLQTNALSALSLLVNICPQEVFNDYHESIFSILSHIVHFDEKDYQYTLYFLKFMFRYLLAFDNEIIDERLLNNKINPTDDIQIQKYLFFIHIIVCSNKGYYIFILNDYDELVALQVIKFYIGYVHDIPEELSCIVHEVLSKSFTFAIAKNCALFNEKLRDCLITIIEYDYNLIPIQDFLKFAEFMVSNNDDFFLEICTKILSKLIQE